MGSLTPNASFSSPADSRYENRTRPNDGGLRTVSGRPQEILADLTDGNGHHHRLSAAPFHPDWPGA